MTWKDSVIRLYVVVAAPLGLVLGLVLPLAMSLGLCLLLVLGLVLVRRRRLRGKDGDA